MSWLDAFVIVVFLAREASHAIEVRAWERAMRESNREVRRICAWLRSLDHMLDTLDVADDIERGDWRTP